MTHDDNMTLSKNVWEDNVIMIFVTRVKQTMHININIVPIN